MKDKKTIINLAPIPCPLSLPLTCGTHMSDSSSTFPLRILPQRRTRGRPVLPLRCTTAAAAVARAAARRVLRRAPAAAAVARAALHAASSATGRTLRHTPTPATVTLAVARAAVRAACFVASRALRCSMPQPPSCRPPRVARATVARAVPSAAACPGRRRAGRRHARRALCRTGRFHRAARGWRRGRAGHGSAARRGHKIGRDSIDRRLLCF